MLKVFFFISLLYNEPSLYKQFLYSGEDTLSDTDNTAGFIQDNEGG